VIAIPDPFFSILGSSIKECTIPPELQDPTGITDWIYINVRRKSWR